MITVRPLILIKVTFLKHFAFEVWVSICFCDIPMFLCLQIHANDVLTFHLQPYKLQRLSLEAAYKFRSVTQNDWHLLPRQLRDSLEKKRTIDDKMKYRQPDWKPPRLGSTCSIS